MTTANKGVPANLIAFPSVSSSLHSLPQATSMQNVSLHPNMYAQRAAESEAKANSPAATKGSVKNAVFIYTANADDGLPGAAPSTILRPIVTANDAFKIEILDMNVDSSPSSPLP